MIAFELAKNRVLNHAKDFGQVSVPLEKALDRVLAEPIAADRDFPPFDRATKDGIAMAYDAFAGGCLCFDITAIAAAGSPQQTLESRNQCIEVMTGAMLPLGTDTVVMYEHLEIKDGKAMLLKSITKGQNIHYQGTDETKGSVLLQAGVRIGPAEIGILAAVGKTSVLIKKNPSICVVSTGDELVALAQTPKPYEIRKSNVHSLQAALVKMGLKSEAVHVKDDKLETEKALAQIIDTHDVVLLSGGVSKGKYDYLPSVFEALSVEKVFHKVRQRPGKPFWFGVHKDAGTTIFAFPGNPVSTFANFHIYFVPWLNTSLGVHTPEINVILEEAFGNTTDLTRFLSAKVTNVQGKLIAKPIHANGSGDLISLSLINGFLQVPPKVSYKKGEQVRCIPILGKPIL